MICISPYPRSRFQHTAARRRLGKLARSMIGKKGFNTQPPEGGWQPTVITPPPIAPFQHTAARRRLGFPLHRPQSDGQFQHTAARRRLVTFFIVHHNFHCFNTQPPEGGWCRPALWFRLKKRFQHTAARRRLG